MKHNSKISTDTCLIFSYRTIGTGAVPHSTRMLLDLISALLRTLELDSDPPNQPSEPRENSAHDFVVDAATTQKPLVMFADKKVSACRKTIADRQWFLRVLGVTEDQTGCFKARLSSKSIFSEKSLWFRYPKTPSILNKSSFLLFQNNAVTHASNSA